MTLRQLVLDLPVRAALGREDFFVAPSNAAAVAALDDMPRWSSGRLALVGAPGSGKSHLAQVWAGAAGAQVVAAAALTVEAAPRLAHGALAVEDADRTLADEPALFHLLNLAAERGVPVLLTARVPPARWPVALPDLASRLQAAGLARIEPPDDALIQALLVKLFADRQVTVTPALIPWLATRIDRSHDAIGRTVDRLDRAALAHHRPIRRGLAAQVLDIAPPEAT